MTKIRYSRVADFIREIMDEDPALTQTAVAKAAGMPLSRLNQILLGRRRITAETDLRLSRVFGLSEGMLMSWQNNQDLADARDELGRKLDKVKRLIEPVAVA